MKEVGPRDDLRRWFGHDPSRWDAFADRYRPAPPARMKGVG
jgi:uncharacterized protein YeaO (DUF488 family)